MLGCLVWTIRIADLALLSSSISPNNLHRKSWLRTTFGLPDVKPPMTSGLNGSRCCWSWTVVESIGHKTFESALLYLSIGKGRKVQDRPYNVASTKSTSLECYFIVKKPENGKLYVCKEYHHYILYPMEDKRQLASVLKLEPVDFSPFSLFIVDGYL